MHRSSGNLWAGVAILVFAGACKCSEPPLNKTDQCKGVSGVQADKLSTCADNAECADHFACAALKDQPGLQCCVFQDRKCTTEADCCPGQTCPADRKKCFDKYLACERDADCGDKGDRFCEVYTDTYGTSSRCRFKPCGAVGECPEGQSCFQGECMADLPCQGTCEPGKACVPSIDRCQDYASPTDRPQAACPVTCNAGFIATFKDPRNIWDACILPDVQCVCAELPGLHSGDLGRFSAIAADPGKGVFVSEYDGEYGDLVVVKYGLDGVKQATEYVDGVPQAAVKYGPSGARGGIVEPGPDVGRYTDIAMSNGQAYVSYYDYTNGDLKVALRSAVGAWTKHKVDGTNGNVGLYSSIAIDSDGYPGVSYFQLAADASFNVADCPAPAPTGAKEFITALKFARATTATPAAESDWVVRTVACLSRPTPPCYQCANVCADPGTGPACLSASSGCTGCDPNTEACVTSGTASVCAKKYNPSTLVDVPLGVGVFSSLAFNGKAAVVAYMRRTLPATAGAVPQGDLYGVGISAANVASAPVLLDANGDTGFFPDVKLEPATKSVAVTYHDFTSKSLKFYFAPQLQTGVTPEVIDNGVTASIPGEQSWVGTDSAIVFGPAAGQVWAVYQDATRGDLKLARRGAQWTVQPSVSTTGAVGFFADGVFTDGKVYASHARVHAKLVSGEPKVDNSLLLELIPGN